MSTKSPLRSEANLDPHCYGCLLVLREMVPRGHRLYLPMADEVQGQADHKHADAERGSDGEADQHDQHSLAVSLGMGWEGQEGPHPGFSHHPVLGSYRPLLPGRPSPLSSRSLCSAAISESLSNRPICTSRTMPPALCLFSNLLLLLGCPLAQ